MYLVQVASFAILIIFTVSETNAETYTFPKYFKFGVASASYQIEGGWDEDGKGENIWDRLTHTRSELIRDQSSGDVACDSYHRLERDLDMLVKLEVDYYRFSLSWSRILPTGFRTFINQPGIDYYNGLIDGLLARNITPVVTIFHWDLPQSIQDLGGWTNELIVDYFTDYSNIVFAAFGDRVKTWITINEPREICRGYGSFLKAPASNSHGVGDYLCVHNLHKAHAKAYHLYDDVYRSYHAGSQIGITLNPIWYEARTDSIEDVAATVKAMRTLLGWYSDPIFSSTGDYPPELRELVDKKSEEQGYLRSRMPYFTADEVQYIKGTSDFFGLNHYTTNYVQYPLDDPQFDIPSIDDDVYVKLSQDESWPTSASMWLKVVPWGFRKLLNWIKDEYNNPNVVILENGFSSKEGIEDDDRVYYYREYLKMMSEAINKDGCNVIAYTAWTLMDNFEWMQGYTERFGLFEVDFNSTEKTTTMRKSAYVYRDIIRHRAVLDIEPEWR